MITSLQTVYLAYETNQAAAGGLILSGQSAELALHLLEPIQVGYGAVVSAYKTARLWMRFEKRKEKKKLMEIGFRFCPSSEPSTGDLSGLDTEESSAGGDTPLV